MEQFIDLLHSTQDLVRFNLFGITTFAKVIDIYDGDTFDMAILIPTEQLCQARKISKTKTGICLITNNYSPMVMRFKCRLDGLDAREKKDTKGLEAKEMFAKLIENKIIKCNLKGYDKYGRLLVQIYSNSIGLHTHLEFVNDYLLLRSDLFLPYDGKTKLEFSDE
jgi:endonuclease YncB( thermonuclease family)